jgi:hypothetical protein
MCCIHSPTYLFLFLFLLCCPHLLLHFPPAIKKKKNMNIKVRQARINKDGREPFAEYEVVCKLKLVTTKVWKENANTSPSNPFLILLLLLKERERERERQGI